MKKRVVLGAAAAVFLVCLSFSLGFRQGRRDEAQRQEQIGQALLSFAADRLEELKAHYRPEVAAALASDAYAAYWYEADPAFSSALHDLWNALLFDGENLAGREDALIKALETRNAQSLKSLAKEMRTPEH